VIDHWEPGYWVVRGWDHEARMKATSVIDTVATNMMNAQHTAHAHTHRGNRPPRGPLHIDGQDPCGQRRMDGGGAAHAHIRSDLGDMAIRLAHTKG
jgi:hypothetical protein